MSADGLAISSAATTPRLLSGTIRDYLSLTKPSIVLLLLITTVPAMVLAAGGWPATSLVVATLVGGMLASGGACAVNMYIDRNIDAVMVRTRARPLPRGVIPPSHALTFGVLQGLGSGIWLVLTVNALSAALALLAFFFYTVVYSYLKRTTVHSTVLGGLAGAAPPLIGWTAVTGQLGTEGLLLFLLVLVWQPPHFWTLALEYRQDYRAAGLPMLTVVRGEDEAKRQIVRYSFLTVCVSLVFGLVAGLSPLYLLVSLVGGFALMRFAYRLQRSPGVAGTRPMFHYSTTYLAALFLTVLADRLLLA